MKEQIEDYIEVLKPIILFENIEEKDLKNILECIDAKIKSYKKGGIILDVEDKINSIGVILNGEIQIIKEDYYGNRNIMAHLGQGDIFGEVFVCGEIEKIPVTVKTDSGCKILFLNYKKILEICSSTCPYHSSLIRNMLKLLSRKNMLLNEKIEFLSKRSIREKLLSFFEAQVEKNKNKKFKINFSRGELADFLCVDRSAMSRELSKMKDEKIIKIDKNNFQIL